MGLAEENDLGLGGDARAEYFEELHERHPQLLGVERRDGTGFRRVRKRRSHLKRPSPVLEISGGCSFMVVTRMAGLSRRRPL